MPQSYQNKATGQFEKQMQIDVSTKGLKPLVKEGEVLGYIGKKRTKTTNEKLRRDKRQTKTCVGN